MVARTIELVVQLRFEPHTGRRRVSSIFEVTGWRATCIAGQELWALDPARDRLMWTGIQPRALDKMRARGIPYAPPTALERRLSSVAAAGRWSVTASAIGVYLLYDGLTRTTPSSTRVQRAAAGRCASREFLGRGGRARCQRRAHFVLFSLLRRRWLSRRRDAGRSWAGGWSACSRPCWAGRAPCVY